MKFSILKIIFILLIFLILFYPNLKIIQNIKLFIINLLNKKKN